MLDAIPPFGKGFEIEHIPVTTTMVASPVPPDLPRVTKPPEPLQLPAGEKKEVATSCIACSRSHLVTISGMLDEALRFAREGGITDPQALERIGVAEREVVNMERFDLSPEKILNSPTKEQDLARSFLPKIRKLRQDIGQMASVEQLEQAAAESSILTNEFRLRQMEMAGANLNPIIALAKAVERGEISIEEARVKVKEFLPVET